MKKIDISPTDLLTPFSTLEEKYHVKNERNDIPVRFVGFCPSKYYKIIDINLDKLRNEVDNLLQKFLLNNPQ